MESFDRLDSVDGRRSDGPLSLAESSANERARGPVMGELRNDEE